MRRVEQRGVETLPRHRAGDLQQRLQVHERLLCVGTETHRSVRHGIGKRKAETAQ